jgi:hypothetical protein
MKKQTKKCSKCKLNKGLSEFFVSSTQPSGYQSNCIDCNRISSRAWYQNSSKEKTKLSSRKTLLKIKYGLTLEEYQKILESQNGVCAICGLKETSISNKKGGVDSLRVDHCHTTGKIRGLLCSKCNFGLGNFKDSLKYMMSAVAYLLKFNQLNKNDK